MEINEIMKNWQWCCQGRYRLSNYVSNYVSQCIGEEKPIQLLTPWCLSKSLGKRYDYISSFQPLFTESHVVKDFLWCHEILQQANLVVNHFILLLGSAVTSGQLDEQIKNDYQIMLESLVERIGLDAVLLRQPINPPTESLIEGISRQLNSNSLNREVDRRVELAKKNGGWLTIKQARAEAIYSIAFKANEAKQLVEVFGDFLLVPLEYIERYQYHNLGYPRFTDRLLPIVKPYPWRLDN